MTEGQPPPLQIPTVMTVGQIIKLTQHYQAMAGGGLGL